ncbi:MAG: PAS domain S-box protein [Rhodospirillaceae bacterium]|jgi:PAS domain S-box-containing protein|nr:PAS domain S-box protein [Rhodospirillaceae bacterium]MBT6405549.1 PAS domain S-box protein [Rhodospirillaceae bacterium]MBT6535398.1 PAS domain S-box protein [Rhodospirillaceae bacterium]
MSLDLFGSLNANSTASVIALILAALLLIGGAVALHRIIRLKRQFAPYLHTFETASVGMTHSTLAGKWIRVNAKMQEITGYSSDEMITREVGDITLSDDMDNNEALNQQLIEGTIDSYELQKRYARKDGRVIWVKVTAMLARTADGHPDYYIAIVEDIDELKRSQLALQENEARFRAFWDNSPFNQSVKDKLGNLLEINQTYRRTFGIPDTAITGQSLSETHDASWAPQVDEFDREVLRTETTRTADITVPGKDGEEIIIRVTKFPVYDSHNEVAGVGGVSYDITGQVRAAQEIREREERFRATFDQAAVGIAHLSFDGNWLRINARYCEILGYTEAELRTLSFRDITHKDDLGEDLDARAGLIAGTRDTLTREKRYIRKDGSPVWVAVTASKTDQSGSQEPYLIVVIEDITVRKDTELALAARAEQQAAIMDIGQRALSEHDLNALLSDAANVIAQIMSVDFCLISQRDRSSSEFSIVGTNDAGKKYVGWPVQPRIRHLKTIFEAPALEPVVFHRGDQDSPDITSPIMEDIGTISAASVVIAGDDNTPRGILIIHNQTHREFTNDEITFLQTVANILSAAISRDHIASDLAEREEMLDTVLENAADAIIVANASGDIVMANRASEDIFGFNHETILHMNLRDLVPITYQSASGSSDVGPRPQFSTREMIGVHRDQSKIPIEVAMTQFEGPNGTMHISLVRDITEQKSLQSQLTQASKLATVGEMAAGIAHELNQPLNIMRMAADNVLIRADAGTADLDYAKENLELISEQAGRMGKIILHMRVFSRQDTSDFVAFDPARAIRNACELMRGQLELEGVELDVQLPDSNHAVYGSESQLEQVLINMITNARDSVRETAPTENGSEIIGTIGVKLIEDTDDAVICMRVRDTGGGISEASLERIFDPFFTTKEVGVGTGLGLSVSYGIVNAMGGSIVAQNVEGGCEFVVELPITQEAEDETSAGLPTLQAQELR